MNVESSMEYMEERDEILTPVEILQNFLDSTIYRDFVRAIEQNIAMCRTDLENVQLGIEAIRFLQGRLSVNRQMLALFEELIEARKDQDNVRRNDED